MSYLSRYSGVLKFAQPVEVEHLTTLQGILQEDIRKHLEWAGIRHVVDPEGHLTFVDLDIEADRSGLEVYSPENGASTNQDVAKLVNFVTALMELHFPGWHMTGQLDAVTCEGKPFRIKLDEEDGYAREVEVKIVDA